MYKEQELTKLIY